MGAETTALAETELDSLPEGPLAWIALDLSGIDGEISVTSPAPGFLYAHEGSHGASADGEEVTLEPGEAVFVPAGSEVMLESGAGLWHIVLADPEKSSRAPKWPLAAANSRACPTAQPHSAFSSSISP
jgi:hypothetical protein